MEGIEYGLIGSHTSEEAAPGKNRPGSRRSFTATPHTDFLITLALKEKISIDWLLLGKGRMKRSR
jgi:hypothetical protein